MISNEAKLVDLRSMSVCVASRAASAMTCGSSTILACMISAGLVSAGAPDELRTAASVEEGATSTRGASSATICQTGRRGLLGPHDPWDGDPLRHKPKSLLTQHCGDSTCVSVSCDARGIRATR